MRYLLDSDAVTVFYDDQRKPQHGILHQRIVTLDDDALQTSALVLCELEYRYFNAPSDKDVSAGKRG